MYDDLYCHTFTISIEKLSEGETYLNNYLNKVAEFMKGYPKFSDFYRRSGNIYNISCSCSEFISPSYGKEVLEKLISSVQYDKRYLRIFFTR